MTDESLNKRKKRLIALLREPEVKIRVAAADALEQVEARLNAMNLIEQLEKGEPIKRAKALHTLPLLRDQRVLDALIKSLSDSEERIQAMAGRALGEHGRPEAVEPLLAHLEKAESTVVQCECIIALGKLRNREAVPALRRLLQKEDSKILAAALEALGSLADPALGEEIEPFIDHESLDVRIAAISAFGRLDPSDAVPY